MYCSTEVVEFSISFITEVYLGMIYVCVKCRTGFLLSYLNLTSFENVFVYYLFELKIYQNLFKIRYFQEVLFISYVTWKHNTNYLLIAFKKLLSHIGKVTLWYAGSLLWRYVYHKITLFQPLTVLQNTTSKDLSWLSGTLL